jgi:putative acetyltransferase
MIDTARPISFRRYQAADHDAVASLWTRINRELAPIGMEEIFERYIAMTIEEELKQLLEIFSEARRSAFWVVECPDTPDKIVGSFGIESRSVSDTELRRMSSIKTTAAWVLRNACSSTLKQKRGRWVSRRSH